MPLSMKPEGSSTPSTVPAIKGRRPIHEALNIPSPIPATNTNEKINTMIDTTEDEDSDTGVDLADEDDNVSEIIPQKLFDKGQNNTSNTSIDASNSTENKEGKYSKLESRRSKSSESGTINRSALKTPSKLINVFSMQYFLACFLVIIAVGVFGAYTYKQHGADVQEHVDLHKLKEYFPQDEKFWSSIHSAILEVKKFEKPSVVILIYKSDMYNISNLLSNITTYASCILNDDCHMEPIILKGNDLNTNDLITDYGILIDRYRLLLEERRVMLVENLDEIIGSVAQAFHYFCDEYTPLVKKSLILFTIQVNQYERNDLKQVVSILEKKWSDIDSDKLEPLITRVSSIILRIK